MLDCDSILGGGCKGAERSGGATRCGSNHTVLFNRVLVPAMSQAAQVPSVPVCRLPIIAAGRLARDASYLQSYIRTSANMIVPDQSSKSATISRQCLRGNRVLL